MSLLAKLDSFPTAPGVYLMKNHEGKVIYVGKAKNLKKRLKQYFGNTRDSRAMVPLLVEQTESIDTLITLSEKEALLLENTLIKKHQPKFNAVLKDDKTFLSLQINPKTPWPQLKLVRFKTSSQDALVFGPYTSALAAKTTYELLLKLFPLRQCSDEEFKRRTRPCLLYSLKRCQAPCVGKCTKEEYDLVVQSVIQFLQGEDKTILERLLTEMKKASDNLEFEKAASLLRTLRAIEEVLSSSSLVAKPNGISRDVIGLYRDGSTVIVIQLVFRQGSLIGSESYSFENSAQEEEELLSSLLLQIYASATFLPDEILLPCEALSEKETLIEILSKRGKKLSLLFPKKGEKIALVDLANQNAKAVLQTKQEESTKYTNHLNDLQTLCKLSRYPQTIACLDTSHISGSNPVASIVIFTAGKKDKQKGRLFKIKGTKASDDYGALREVLTRYLVRAKEEDTLPDLIIVDGGKGQLSTSMRVLEELDIIHIDLISLTKEQGRHDKGLTEERVFLPHHHDPIQLNARSSLLFFLQNIRDEAHRTALSFHLKERTKRHLSSSLDSIPGIGPIKRTRLLKHFGSLEQIRKASKEELKQVKGITDKDIAQILQFSLHSC